MKKVYRVEYTADFRDRRSYIYADSETEALAKLRGRFPRDMVKVRSVDVPRGKFIVGSHDMKFCESNTN